MVASHSVRAFHPDCDHASLSLNPLDREGVPSTNNLTPLVGYYSKVLLD
jgi:hypothetical protein